MHLKCRNVNDAFRTLVETFNSDGWYNQGVHTLQAPIVKRSSRYGDVRMIEEPVIVTYACPKERVLFNSARDVNPFFSMYESMWMLAGRNDLAPLAYYNSRMKEFSDDGKVLNGAYGYRWRWQWERDGKVVERTLHDELRVDKRIDQLDLLVAHLKAKPDSRRAVLQMWNVEDDLLKIGEKCTKCGGDGWGRAEYREARKTDPQAILDACLACRGKGTVNESKDTCCNLSVLFSLRVGEPETRELPLVTQTIRQTYLDMTVTNRSNDLCLAGETKFRSPEGDASIAYLARKFQTEKGFKYPVYSVDTLTGDQRLCWMTNAWKTGVKPVLKLGFDDGSFVRLTGDHVLFKKTKVFDGKRCTGLKVEEKQACELSVGDRVLADVAEKASTRSGSYVQYKKNLFNNTSFQNLGDEHRHYWEFMTGESLGEYEVHHRDENKRNNAFANLEKLSRSVHRSRHLRKSNPNGKMTPQQVFDRASKGGKTHKGKPFSTAHKKALSDAAKIVQATRERDDKGHFMSNHKITSIERDGMTVVYDFTVPSRHNAVLSNGVLAHNCWGLLGANVVHFSFLQEYMAARIGAEVGVYNHFTNNLHCYDKTWEPEKWLDEYQGIKGNHPYDGYTVEGGIRITKPFPLVADPVVFEQEMPVFVEVNDGTGGQEPKCFWKEPFLQTVAQPMCNAFRCHKARDYASALRWCEMIAADDWRTVSKVWISKRRDKYVG